MLSPPPGQVEVEIRYSYTPPDPVTLAQRCNYEPPGASAAVELRDVTVTSWTVDDLTHQRGNHWVWLLLDAWAFIQIVDNWDHYQHTCLERETLEN
jgi:hypothetical protein